MHDIRLIRDDREQFADSLKRRGVSSPLIMLNVLDRQSRTARQKIEGLNGERKRASTFVNQLRGAGQPEEAMDWVAKSIEAATQIDALKAEIAEVDRELERALSSLPNLPAQDVPDGLDEVDNIVVHRHGEPPLFDFAPREHFEFGAALGLDFESAQAVAGARFAYLRGPVARLNRALGQFMLDVHTIEFGYEEVAPPLLVRDIAAYGTGQLPKLGEDMFRTTDDRLLIPTAEVSLTNLVRDRILPDKDLPLRFVALTPCFRSEAGAAGRDTRGLIRQHQFDKVELVSVVTPERSEDEHERMTRAAETILERLGLPYRRMLLCAGDMGFAARKTYDLEVWLPGQDRYREISSCSNCGDFQARRMAARFRRAGAKGTTFVHTLNGSGVAVGRALVAVLENYQASDGSVTVPQALLPYTGGMTILDPSCASS